ncbi:MAG: hypothetical protein ACRDBO_10955 [Lachnospiraceae bacterium]
MKKYKIQAAGCLAGSVLLYGILTLTARPVMTVSEDGTIARSGYGGSDQQIQLYVDGLAEQAVPLAVAVRARSYTEAAAEAVFEQIMDDLAERIRGDNPSLLEVRSDLYLPSWLDDYGVRLRWYSSDPERMDSTGKIASAGVADEAGEFLRLYVQLSAGDIRRDYELPVRLLPRIRSGAELLAAGLEEEIKRREEGQQSEEFLSLPVEYEGKVLHYRTEEDAGYSILLVLGVLLAVLCYAKAQTDAQAREKDREKQLLLDYAEIVSKLMVFIGAGMTIRLVWERIVKDYERLLQTGKQQKRAAYEEMCQTYYQLESGVSEGEAFREFGRRCRLQPYLKLSSLLEQNRREGSKHLRTMLHMEMHDAWELRKNLARRMGEEAGTKLLAPLFLMLGIVMVMIMVPAMMTMG